MVIKIHKEKKMTYKVQIDDEVRDATAEEIAEIEARQAAELARQAEAEAKAQAKAELLERLGITADEAKLLLA
jgi:DNA recombination-dependent growth factor C